MNDDNDNDNTMACTAVGLPLPLELVMRIVNYCTEYDPPEDKYDDFVMRQDSGVYNWTSYDRMTWSTIPWPAHQNVIRVRLVCKQFRDAFFQEFGKIMGDRKFRLTKTGLQDLREIGEMEQLVPWIKTLTFGSACMRDAQGVTPDGYGYGRYLDAKPAFDLQFEAIKNVIHQVYD
jgi:hypothetical protein